MPSPIRQYLPHLIVGLSISLITVGAYMAVSFASSTAPKALWTTNPLAITFSGDFGTRSSASAIDSFKCAPPVTSSVVLHTSVSDPTKISLEASPSAFDSCGPSFSSVTITAQCLVVAPNCKGTYTGTFTIFQGYATFPPSLSVTIVVT